MINNCFKYEGDDGFITITILLSQVLNILSQLLNNNGAHYLNIQIIVTRGKLFRSQKDDILRSQFVKNESSDKWVSICDVHTLVCKNT